MSLQSPIGICLTRCGSITGVEWIAGKRYKVRGFWVADAKTMCFDLNEGVQEDFRSVPQDDRTE